MIFEEFEFASAYRCIAPTLNAYNDTRSLFGDPQAPSPEALPAEVLLLVDTGYSHTTVTPLFHGRPAHNAIRRLNIAGKQISNLLSELISLRHFNVRDERYIVDEIKEDACFVSTDFTHDIEACWSGNSNRKDLDRSVVVDYVLPDYTNTYRGFLRPHDSSRAAELRRLGLSTLDQPKEDFFPLGNERFGPPELLFNPSDVGLSCEGVPGMIMQSLSTLPEALRAGLLANVMVVGGCSLLPGFIERLDMEVKKRVNSDFVVRVRRAEE
ncbi:Actin-related protein 6 [Elasticomyces elasticus]|nr:Actin-related protein 6 [Elasticomyces elasticus]